jgi:hypothetical protein
LFPYGFARGLLLPSYPCRLAYLMLPLVASGMLCNLLLHAWILAFYRRTLSVYDKVYLACLLATGYILWILLWEFFCSHLFRSYDILSFCDHSLGSYCPYILWLLGCGSRILLQKGLPVIGLFCLSVTGKPPVTSIQSLVTRLLVTGNEGPPLVIHYQRQARSSCLSLVYILPMTSILTWPVTTKVIRIKKNIQCIHNCIHSI